jgi:hypothetical protein
MLGLKKADMDTADTKSYWPLSNLLVLSKLLKRLVSQQINLFLMKNHLLSKYRSAYLHHSMETTLLKVLPDILLALGHGKIGRSNAA